MTGKELVARTLQGLDTPHVPSGPLAVHYCAVHAGYTLREYTTNPEALADSVIRYYERFQPDAVWVSADTWVSAEAMGAKVGATGEDQPFGGQGRPRVESAADIERIPSPDTRAQGRYPLMLEALSRVVDAVGEEVVDRQGPLAPVNGLDHPPRALGRRFPGKNGFLALQHLPKSAHDTAKCLLFSHS